MASAPFFALITPIDQPQPGQPPGIWGGGNQPFPTPPIHLPPGSGSPPSGSPPGIWGPPGPWPTPPIHLPPTGGGSPPGIWGGAPIPWPTPPIHYPPSIWPSPGHPEHPIYYPPGIWGPTDPRPGWGLPGQPPGIWGPPSGLPTPPIVIPPEGLPPDIAIPDGKALVVVYVPGQGHQAFLIPAPGPGYNPPSGGAVPTPQEKS